MTQSSKQEGPLPPRTDRLSRRDLLKLSAAAGGAMVATLVPGAREVAAAPLADTLSPQEHLRSIPFPNEAIRLWEAANDLSSLLPGVKPYVYSDIVDTMQAVVAEKPVSQDSLDVILRGWGELTDPGELQAKANEHLANLFNTGKITVRDIPFTREAAETFLDQARKIAPVLVLASTGVDFVPTVPTRGGAAYWDGHIEVGQRKEGSPLNGEFLVHAYLHESIHESEMRWREIKRYTESRKVLGYAEARVRTAHTILATWLQSPIEEALTIRAGGPLIDTLNFSGFGQELNLTGVIALENLIRKIGVADADKVSEDDTLLTRYNKGIYRLGRYWADWDHRPGVTSQSATEEGKVALKILQGVVDETFHNFVSPLATKDKIQIWDTNPATLDPQNHLFIGAHFHLESLRHQLYYTGLTGGRSDFLKVRQAFGMGPLNLIFTPDDLKSFAFTTSLSFVSGMLTLKLWAEKQAEEKNDRTIPGIGEVLNRQALKGDRIDPFLLGVPDGLLGSNAMSFGSLSEDTLLQAEQPTPFVGTDSAGQDFLLVLPSQSDAKVADSGFVLGAAAGKVFGFQDTRIHRVWIQHAENNPGLVQQFYVNDKPAIGIWINGDTGRLYIDTRTGNIIYPVNEAVA